MLCRDLILEELLLVKYPPPHKTQKNNAVLHCQGAPADRISLLKTKLHKCGRAGIFLISF